MPGSVIHERVCSDESFGMKLFTYRLFLDHGGSRDWALAKSGCQSEDLELIPHDVVPDRLRSGFRWVQSRSWPCFALDVCFLVDRENLKTSFRR